VISNQPQDSIIVVISRPGHPHYFSSIPALATNVTINVTTNEDNSCEDETFTLTYLTIVSSLLCVIGDPGSATVTVENDDSE